MPHLHRISTSELRDMAREATSMFLNDGTPLNDAIVKVASSFEHPLTSEHVRRVCEMTYHDTFERGFRDRSGDNRVVNFDPPEAEKIASAIRAERVRSFRDKLASASAEGGEHEKAASAPAFQVPRAPNAFSSAMGEAPRSHEVDVLEAKDILKTAQSDVSEAIHALEVTLGSIKHAEALAYLELGQHVRQSVLDGMAPDDVLHACEVFMKTASVPEHISVDVLAALATDMLEAGIELGEKQAGLLDPTPNTRHPICARVVKVGSLRAEKFATEIALNDLRYDAARVEQELKHALFE